jgi:hypothetical protein
MDDGSTLIKAVGMYSESYSAAQLYMLATVIGRDPVVKKKAKAVLDDWYADPARRPRVSQLPAISKMRIGSPELLAALPQFTSELLLPPANTLLLAVQRMTENEKDALAQRIIAKYGSNKTTTKLRG